MQVIIGEHTYEVSKDVSTCLDLVEKKVQESGLHVSHLIIDGQEVYSDFEQYMNHHINNMEKIEVILSSMQELLAGTIQTARSYLEQASPSLMSLSEMISSNSDDQRWDKFQQFLDGVTWLVQFIGIVKSHAADPIADELQGIEEKIHQLLAEMEEAMQNGDYGLISDLIQFEIIPVYESLSAAVHTMAKGDNAR